MIDGDNLPFLEKLVYGLTAILVWVGVKSYKVGGAVSDFKGELKILKVRVDDRERDCPQMQEALFERLSNILHSSIDKNISSIVLEQTKVLGEMSKQLALLSQSHDELTKKVSELGGRRMLFKHPADTGMRRRLTDYAEGE